ncbi:hypothetical protein ACEW7V_02250 [Areca yellow leaf disease phytoplasma]
MKIVAKTIPNPKLTKNIPEAPETKKVEKKYKKEPIEIIKTFQK